MTEQPQSGRAPGSRSDRHRRRKSSRKLAAIRPAGQLGRRCAVPAVVAAALVGVVGLAYATRPEPARAGLDTGTERAPVETSAVACPEAGGSSSASTRIAVATAGASSGAGKAVVEAVDGEGEPTAVVRDPGTASYQRVRGDTLAVRANGALAAGMAAEQVTQVGQYDPRLAGVRCVAPAMSFWFLGPGPSELEDGRLYLTNMDPTTATVDIDVFTPEGMVDPAGGRSITVEPYGQETVRIDDLAPNTRLAALHVRTLIGQVSAAVRTRTQEPAGVDWIPSAQEPATDLVVPGLPKGNDERRLLVVAPGRKDATVTVHVVTDGGTYVPEGRETVHVPAGSMLDLDLAAGLSGKAAAVRLTSDVPVTAGAYASMGVDAGTSDVGFTAATPPLDGMAVVADNRAGGGRSSVLILSAPQGEALVRVATITPDGTAGEPATVRVPRGRTAAVRVPAPRGSGGGFAVVAQPRPGSGPVYGARLLEEKVTGGRVGTLLPLVTARTWVTVPAVGDSLSAVITPPRR